MDEFQLAGDILKQVKEEARNREVCAVIVEVGHRVSHAKMKLLDAWRLVAPTEGLEDVELIIEDVPGEVRRVNGFKYVGLEPFDKRALW